MKVVRAPIEPGSAPARYTGLALPRWRITHGSIEALKWLALLLMIGDHVNKHLLRASVLPLFAAGRAAMPIFALLLGYNLARPGALANGVFWRVLTRLGIGASIATIPFIGLGGLGWGWWPLNVMATLWLSAAAICLLELGGSGRACVAALLLVVGGLFVEYWWPALAIALAAWSYAKRPNWCALLIGVAALSSLYVINKTWWAFAALPLVALASAVHLPVPRVRWVFYVFYPVHLAAIWAVRTMVLS